MTANRKVVLIVILGACAGMLGFAISQYFSQRTHGDQVLLARVRSIAPRIEHIRLLSQDFVRYGDATHWDTIVQDMDALEAEMLSGPDAGHIWTDDVQDLKSGLAAYRGILDRIHDPALQLQTEKTRLEDLGRAFSQEVRTHIIEPYRKEEGVGMYQGRRIDPFKTRIKETAYDVMLLHVQQQQILLELIGDGDLSGYRSQKEILSQAMEKRKTQLTYLGVLMGGDTSIGPVIASLGKKMDDLVGIEKLVIGTFEGLTQMKTELMATGDRLLQAGENLTAKIVADISAADRLNRQLSWGLLIAILGGMGILGALLAGDIIRFLKEIENSREALQESKERLDLALDGANEGIWDWYLEQNKIEFDARYYTMAGYVPDAFPHAFEEWEKRVHPDDIQKTKATVEQYLSGELETFDVEFRFMRKDGDYMWIQGRGKIVARNEQGDPIRFVGTHADITPRKRIEESLRITQFSFDRANIGIYRITADAQILDVNDRAAQMVGYSKAALAAMSIFDIDPLVTAENWGGIWQRLVDKGTDNLETRHRTKDGRNIPVEIFSNLLEYGGQQYSIVFVQDISERKRIEQFLLESEERYRTIHDASFGGIFIHDQGVVLECNQGLSEITGYTLDELIGMDALNTLIAPDWRETVRRNFTSGYGQPYDVEGVRKDGTIYPLNIQGKNIPYKGRTVRAVEYRDITEKKLAEEALQKNYIQLKAIYSTLPIIIWSLDENGIFTLAEGKELVTWDMQPGDFVGLSAFDLYKDNLLILENIKTALKGQYCEYESEIAGAVYHFF
jgi:PAS domain S-box-containing protein